MALMTNAEAFRYDFGIYATELWSMTEEQFLEWMNAECDRERPNAVPVVRCKDCKHNPKESWFGCPMSHLNEKQRPETAWCWKGERKQSDGRKAVL